MTSPETAGPQTSTEGGYTLIEHLPFTTAKVIGARARIGLVVLASDYTIEHEFRAMIEDKYFIADLDQIAGAGAVLHRHGRTGAKKRDIHDLCLPVQGNRLAQPYSGANDERIFAAQWPLSLVMTHSDLKLVISLSLAVKRRISASRWTLLAEARTTRISAKAE